MNPAAWFFFGVLTIAIGLIVWLASEGVRRRCEAAAISDDLRRMAVEAYEGADESGAIAVQAMTAGLAECERLRERVRDLELAREADAERHSRAMSALDAAGVPGWCRNFWRSTPDRIATLAAERDAEREKVRVAELEAMNGQDRAFRRGVKYAAARCRMKGASRAATLAKELEAEATS